MDLKAPPPLQHFALDVRPESLQQPWHAWLLNSEGQTIEFETPLELLRYLLRQNEAPLTSSGLR